MFVQSATGMHYKSVALTVHNIHTKVDDRDATHDYNKNCCFVIMNLLSLVCAQIPENDCTFTKLQDKQVITQTFSS